MRKRGLIILAASSPLWLIVIGWNLSRRPGQWDLSEMGNPLYLDAAQLAALAVTLYACSVLLYDFAKWLRQRSHERNN
jgi:hypothetical protein